MHGLDQIRERQHEVLTSAMEREAKSIALQEAFLKKKNKLIRVTLTKDELNSLQHILWHFTDYMAKDDRPDHGLGVLKEYRNLSEDEKSKLFLLAGKLRRRYNNLKL